MRQQDQTDFAQAMGESFADAVCPPIPFSEASPHECCEAVQAALGAHVSPTTLANMSEPKLTDLALALGEWFESDPPSVGQIRKAVEATLARWPA